MNNSLASLTCFDALTQGIDPVLWVDAQLEKIQNLRLPADMVAELRINLLEQVNAWENLILARKQLDTTLYMFEKKCIGYDKACLERADAREEKAWKRVVAGGWHNCHIGYGQGSY